MISKREILFDIIALAIFWFIFGINLTDLLNNNYINGDFIAQLILTIADGLASIISVLIIYSDFKKLLKHINWLENNNNDDEDEVKE